MRLLRQIISNKKQVTLLVNRVPYGFYFFIISNSISKTVTFAPTVKSLVIVTFAPTATSLPTVTFAQTATSLSPIIPAYFAIRKF